MKVAVWQGFDHFWENDPHRLNQFGTWLTSVDGKHEDTAYHSRMSIGRFPPDVCRTFIRLQEIRSETLGVIDGEVTVTLSGRLGQYAETHAERVVIPLPEPGLTAAVVMRGFELEAANFAHGFHTRGFGFLLDDIRQMPGEDGGECFSFVPVFSIFPDRSPDPTTDPNRFIWRVLPFPGWMEPKTPDEYAYRMTLYYRLLYDRADSIVFTPQTVEHNARSSEAPRRNPVPHVRSTIQGVPEGASGGAVVGIRGFNFELTNRPRVSRNGRYLRKLKFMVSKPQYDAATGTASYEPQMLFTNFGVRDGRRDGTELRRQWGAFLRNRNLKYAERIRGLTRLLLGSYGYDAHYVLHTTLIQLPNGEIGEPELMRNVIRSQGPGTVVAHSLLRVLRRRRARRAARKAAREAAQEAQNMPTDTNE